MATAGLLVAILSEAQGDPDPLAALLARADAVTREVATLRGLRVKKPIAREVIDREELRRRLLAMAEDPQTQAETRAEGLALVRWGIVPRGTDYLALMIELLTDQVAGYYEPRTRTLTISRQAADDPAWAELVLAHEIAHGLQDQAFGLTRFQNLTPGEADEALARRALVEGDAVALMIELALSRRGLEVPWASPAIAADLQRAMGVPTGDVLDRAPLAVRERVLFPYRAGLAFVAALRRREPWSAIDAVFKRPPRSTEQILHPERYEAGDAPRVVALPVPAALAGFTEVHTSVWGELGVQLLLRAHGIPEDTAALAAEGWGGDRAITLARAGETRPDRAIGLARLVWDSEADAIEAHEALVRALDRGLAGATAEHGELRTRWLALDGTVTFAERRGEQITLAVGLPVQLAQPAIAELQASK